VLGSGKLVGTLTGRLSEVSQAMSSGLLNAMEGDGRFDGGDDQIKQESGQAPVADRAGLGIPRGKKNR
jgi:hypothetical protein